MEEEIVMSISESVIVLLFFELSDTRGDTNTLSNG
jgi:hypothetical protein